MKSFAFLSLLASLPVLTLAVSIVEPAVAKPVKRDWPDLDAFLTEVAELFSDITTDDFSDALTNGEAALATLFDIQTTQNLGSGCDDVTVLFARGTFEPGNVGALVGPEFFDALSSMLGSSKSLGIQGVDYPASIEGTNEGDVTEGETMARNITSILSSCPSTQLVLSGYSQGAALVHNAAVDVGSLMSSVAAVVTFGDPDSSTPVAGINPSKVLIICHVGDVVCSGYPVITPQHLTYAVNADEAASFVISQLS
ncbi:hypothetical protein G7Y89_g1125 [Cudoniella acicularis]|uniref:Cutinase n=1 Tax=Cudoniella acicularis TaxID=354080 RepID=A0A8H4RVV7_9HELO|nr:hypothetical protein G7Y89_g1125 [Cudoniella acicularis]